MNADNLYHREFKPLLKKAGLCGFTFHSLRHTCATLLLSKNVNPKIIQEMLGHATVLTTIQKDKTTSAVVSRSATRQRHATARVG